MIALGTVFVGMIKMSSGMELLGRGWATIMGFGWTSHGIQQATR